MRDDLYVFAHEVERLLQFVDASKTGNPSEVRFIIGKLREKIAATRENPNKHPVTQEQIDAWTDKSNPPQD